jgi:glucokinase
LADIVIDTHSALGDASIELPGSPYKTGATSTIAGSAIVQAITAQCAGLLAERGIEPPLWISGNVVSDGAHNKQLLERYRPFLARYQMATHPAVVAASEIQATMADELAIGVDIGGTKIAFALVTRAGEILATYQLPTLPAEGSDAVCDRIAQGIHHLLDQTSQPVAGIGIGCPGYLNPITGVILAATNLAWVDVPLKASVQARLAQDLPIWVLKDANASALGEMYFGAARGYRDFVHITIGTGLGGGAVVEGALMQGSLFAAMEIGHMPFMQTERLCACGMYGCPEMYVSGIGLLAGVKAHLPEYPQSVLAKVANSLTTNAVLDAARAGDQLAITVLDEMSWWLSSVMICLIGVLSPSLFVIGGGLGHAAAEFILPTTHRMLRERTHFNVFRDIPIVEAQVKSSAVGAACRVWMD